MNLIIRSLLFNYLLPSSTFSHKSLTRTPPPNASLASFPLRYRPTLFPNPYGWSRPSPSIKSNLVLSHSLSILRYLCLSRPYWKILMRICYLTIYLPILLLSPLSESPSLSLFLVFPKNPGLSRLIKYFLKSSMFPLKCSPKNTLSIMEPSINTKMQSESAADRTITKSRRQWATERTTHHILQFEFESNRLGWFKTSSGSLKYPGPANSAKWPSFLP